MQDELDVFARSLYILCREVAEEMGTPAEIKVSRNAERAEGEVNHVHSEVGRPRGKPAQAQL